MTKVTLKKTDYVMSRGTETIEFKRGALIDGKQTNLTVSLSMNYKKGLIKTISKLDDGNTNGLVNDGHFARTKRKGPALLAYRNGWKRKLYS